MKLWIAIAFLAGTPLWSQTTTPATVPVTVTEPASKMSFTVPKNGGVITLSFPQKTLNGTATLSGFTGTMNCDFKNSSIVTNPDGTKTLINVTCSIAQPKGTP